MVARCTKAGYALERKTFGVPIARAPSDSVHPGGHGGGSKPRARCHRAAWMVDPGKIDSIVSSMAKLYGADMAMKATTDAVQVFGGYGYTKEYPVES